jgi:AraC-like DNA-binding protein
LAESTHVGLSLSYLVGCSGSTIPAVDGVAEQGGQPGPECEAPAQRIGAPDPRLAGVLSRRYVGFQQPRVGTECWLEPPQPSVTLIVTLQGRLRAGGNRLPGAWVGGLSDSCDRVQTTGPYSCVDLKLTPLGAYRLLGAQMRELAGTTCALDEVWGADGRQIEEQLHDAPDWPSVFVAIERFLLARMAEGRSADPAVERAWSRLCETSGRLSVAALAAEMGCSRRHLTARFHEQVGQPPKAVARLLRFKRVLRLLDAEPRRWADIAFECGYCDQPHLNRDFRDLAGTTPGAYVAARGARAAAVTFVQDSERVAD